MIVVSFKSEVLGAGEFWRGPEDRVDEIRNIPARRMAKCVIADGKTRSAGMWTVEKKDWPHGLRAQDRELL